MFNASMNFNLGEEIEAIRDTVRRFASEEIAPRADEIDKTNSFPNDLWEKMGDACSKLRHDLVVLKYMHQ